MGAAIGVLAATRTNSIQLFVSLAGMVDTREFALTEFGDEIPDKGCMWEEESCPLSQTFMDDLCSIIGTVIEQSNQVKVPWLLLHGSADDVVSPQDSISIKNQIGDRADHIAIEGADHSFNDDHRQEQLDAVVKWLTVKCA